MMLQPGATPNVLSEIARMKIKGPYTHLSLGIHPSAESACICLEIPFGPEEEPLGMGLMLVPCTHRLVVCEAWSNRWSFLFRRVVWKAS